MGGSLKHKRKPKNSHKECEKRRLYLTDDFMEEADMFYQQYFYFVSGMISILVILGFGFLRGDIKNLKVIS